jgi:hypothetical protein
MKTISKHFETIKQAEKFMSSLYNRFNAVSLIKYPINSEKGIYIYQVK